uniref:C2H2-type domain-containing protein n=1 Tax=Timema poppense TaxID=170557 RepID=A0A7R9D6I2_TIMPO|nr:unnamed protein product [Timema poppensis]
MSDAQKHSCVLCNTKLDSKEELQTHFRKHANKEIDTKGRPIVNGGEQPTKHSTQNSRGLPRSGAGKGADIACDVCSEVFETVTMAIQHKFRKHPESAAKHFCPHCGMQFPLKINRDRHIVTHSEGSSSSLFPCPDCGIVFFNEGALNYHSKSTHKRIVALFRPVATPPPSKKIKVNNANEAQSVYYCHLCGFEYIVKFNLQKHLERQHTEEERDSIPGDLIKCTTCEALFYNKKAYDNHNMYHKPDDLYVTSEEQRLQTVSRVDQDFDIRRVLTTAEKFLPPVNRPRKHSSYQIYNQIRLQQQAAKKNCDTKEEFFPSPDSSASSNDSDSDSDVPLAQRLKVTNSAVAKKIKKYIKE